MPRLSIKGTPLTKEEVTGVPKPAKGRVIRCSKCGMGGTLYKIDDNKYVCAACLRR
jgi:hypothetical protein